MGQIVLRWFGNVGKVDEGGTARRMLMTKVSEGRLRATTRLGWMDDMKVALGIRGMTVEAARQCTKEKKEWREIPGVYVDN